MLVLSAVLTFFIGLAHSYLGEKFILIRLFQINNIPKIMGHDWFTKQVLRFAWHLTTVAWWGFAAIMLVVYNEGNNQNSILFIISIVFGISGIFALLFSKGKHLSWIVFFTIGGICLYLVLYS